METLWEPMSLLKLEWLEQENPCKGFVINDIVVKGNLPELIAFIKVGFPEMVPRRLAKNDRLNTWLFNRRLSGEWTSRFDFGYTIFGHRIERKFIYRLPKTTSLSEDDFECFCPICLLRLSWGYSMADPNRDQRNLREETTDLWLKKRRAQQLILRKDHHLFEFYFILFESGRWK